MNSGYSRPNLLLITTDQQRWDTIAAAGAAHLLTPHLNWLCDTGIRYARAYADCPVCAPSRATIMTGQHAWRHGVTANAGQVSPMASRPTLPGLLTGLGYQTRGQGKMHFEPPRANYGFEHMEILPDYYRWVRRQPGAPAPLDHGLGQNEMEPGFSTVPESLGHTRWTVGRSIDFLETRDPTRPFFLWTSLAKPHPPFDPDERYWRLYDDVELPDSVLGDWSATPDSVPPALRVPTWKLNNWQRLGPDARRAAKRAYFACISQVDYTLGLLFARMREMNLLGNTWIVFTSDHGEMLGDHHLGAKSVFLEGSAHVPLLIRPPGQWQADARGGSVDDRLACLADLLPTFLARAGGALPEGMACDGLDLLEGPRRQTLVGHCEGFHMVLADALKYLYCEQGGAELLFDLANDPLERRDLSRSPARRRDLQGLRRVLTRHLAERGHPAAATGRLTATAPAPIEAEVRRSCWPGFHSVQDESCDLLH